MGDAGELSLEGEDLLPERLVDGDAETEIFFADAEGLLAGIAGRFLCVGGLCGVDGFDDGVGDVLGVGLAWIVLSECRWIEGDKDLREGGFAERIARELVGGVAECGDGGDGVEEDGQAGAFPVADGERALGGFDGCGVGGEIALCVEAAWDGELLIAAAMAFERAVGELGHGHVEDEMAGGAGHGEDERVVADGGFGRAPCGEIGHGVGEAEADHAGFRGLPAVGAAAHPVVGVAEGDAADAVGAGEGDGAFHGGVGVEVAGALAAVPTLECAEGGDADGCGMDVYGPILDGGEEAREAEDAVGVDAVKSGLCEETGAELGAFGGEAVAFEDGGEGVVELSEWDAGHIF